MIADRLRLPLVVVRKQGKGFGRLAQFEGTFEPGARALLVDDLSTDGINKTSFQIGAGAGRGRRGRNASCCSTTHIFGIRQARSRS